MTYYILSNGICQFASNRWFFGLPVTIISFTILQVTLFYASPELIARWSIRVPPRRGEPVHLLSYILIHFDAIHLYSNMFVQIVVGIVLEVFHGPIRVAIIYTMAGVIGGAAEAVLTTKSPLRIAGASGAIYGLVGAFGADLIFNWNERRFPLLWLLLFVTYFGFDIAYMDTNGSIALWAHYMGALSGFLYALAVARNIRIECYEPILRLLAIIVDIVLLATILIYVGVVWSV